MKIFSILFEMILSIIWTLITICICAIISPFIGLGLIYLMVYWMSCVISWIFNDLIHRSYIKYKK